MEPSTDSEDQARAPADDLRRSPAGAPGLVAETGQTGHDALQEWAALALLDAIDLGDKLGWLDVDEAERRREAMRASIEVLDWPPA
jgi:hypothetical protein